MLDTSAAINPKVFDHSVVGQSSTSESNFNLWMERGFSRREIGARMLAAVPNLRIFTTPEQPIAGSTQLAFPDHENKNYTQNLKSAVAKNRIDAIWLQRSMDNSMATLDCVVHTAADAKAMALVDNKIAFSEWLGSDPLRADASEVLGVDAIAKEYYRRRDQGREVCIKPVIGVGGQGYWHLNELSGVTFLSDPEERDIHPEVYFAALDKAEQVTEPQRQIMMDWLPGPEVSIDLLCWRGLPLIQAARTKVDGLHRESQRVQSEHATIDHARDIAAKLAMHGIVSLQYRLDQQGVWKMLEVNPRPAGGSIHSEDAGFGIISSWAKLVTGQIEPDKVRQLHDDIMLGFRRVATIL